jgi:hypothetical protein
MLIAALPPAAPPARVVAGVTVTWPLSKPVTSVTPGASLTVRIASKRRSAKVSLVRVNADGRILGLIAAKTLRTGAFTVTVPRVYGAHFSLRLTVAGHKRWSWIRTRPLGVPIDRVSEPVPSATPTPTPTPTPAPSCGPESEPPASAFRGQVQTGASTVAAGSALSYTLENVGEGDLYPTDRVVLLPAGDSSDTLPADAGALLAPGASLTRSLTISADTPPGLYFLRQTVVVKRCDYAYPMGVNSPLFEVTP